MEKFKHGSIEAQMEKFGLTRKDAEEKVRLYKEKLANRKTCKGKTANPYSVDYQMKRFGLTREEAEEKIVMIKRSGSQSYSVEYQMQKYNLTHEEAEQKIVELKNKTATGHLISNPEWQMKRFGISREEAEEKINNAFAKRKNSYIKLKETDPERFHAIRPTDKIHWLHKGYSEKDAIKKSKEYQQNMRNVFIDNMKDPNYAFEHFKKTVKYKKYIMPSGKEVNLQGYEPQVLTELLKTYSEDDIVIGVKDIFKTIGRISYNQNNIDHSYYPDFFIKSEKKIIEVKSKWTYNKWKEKNELKKQACIEAGFNFEFMIWVPKAKTISNECIKFINN